MSRPACIYVRISQDREGAGLGVARQEADCRELAERLGWRVVRVLTDNDTSAYTGKPRKGYMALLEALESGDATGVVVWHTDRLHRSPAELERYVEICERNSVSTQTVKAGPLDLSTPSGRLVARQMGAYARYEVEHNVERIKAARLQAVAAGKWGGGPRPFGYEADGVTPNETEAALIRQSLDDVIAGVSVNEVTRRWNRAGARTSKGGTWDTANVRRVLMRPRNAGLMAHHGKVVGGAEWPAIVNEDRWRAVSAILSNPDRRTNMGAPPRHLGTGILRCGICGDGVTLRSSATRNGRRGYSCPNGKHVFRDGNDLDAYVTAIVLERLSRSDAAELTAPDRPDTSGLHVDAEGLRARLSELASLYADGAIEARQLAEGTAKMRGMLAEVEAKIAEASSVSALSAFVGRDPADVWNGLDTDRRRAVIGALMVVTIFKAPKGRPPGWKPGESYFTTEGIEVEWRGSDR